MKKSLYLLLALALGPVPARAGLFPDEAFSDGARGLAGAQFLKTPPSARFAALGGAGLALGGAEALFLNPAGAAGRASSLSVSYEALLEGSARTALAFSRPSARGAFSAGLIYNDSTPGLYRLDGAGGGDGNEVPAYDAAVSAGWARSFGWTDFGFALKYLRSRLAEASGSSAALDAGFVFREPAPSRTELAVAFRNLGPGLKLGSERDPLPFELGAGMKWKSSPDFNVLAEGRLPADHSPYLVLAAEWYLPLTGLSGFSLRSGLNFRNYDDHGTFGAFAGGFGLKLGGLVFDYAFSPYGDLGAAHRITAGLAWGGPTRAAAAPAALPRSSALAVGPFYAGPGVSATEAAVVRNLVEAELAKTGAFRVTERARLDFILEEKKLAYAGLSEENAAAALARASGADLAVSGLVTREKKGYLVTVRLVDAASGAVLRSAEAEAPEDYLFREAARRLSAALSR